MKKIIGLIAVSLTVSLCSVSVRGADIKKSASNTSNTAVSSKPEEKSSGFIKDSIEGYSIEDAAIGEVGRTGGARYTSDWIGIDTYKYMWSSYFVSWCMYEAGYNDVPPADSDYRSMMSWYYSKRRLNLGSKIKPGDIVFFTENKTCAVVYGVTDTEITVIGPEITGEDSEGKPVAKIGLKAYPRDKDRRTYFIGENYENTEKEKSR